MRLATIWLTLGGIVVGFVIGFLLASSINRSEINQLRADVETARRSGASPNKGGDDSLSDEEIRDKIAEADQNPTNVTFQKNLGLALYRYGSIKSDTNTISEAIRLLDRASKLSPADNDITVGLANAWFDLGYVGKKNDALEKAREFYQTALSRAPQDAGAGTRGLGQLLGAQVWGLAQRQPDLLVVQDHPVHGGRRVRDRRGRACVLGLQVPRQKEQARRSDPR
jgi:tetratricopeptide (TPR) repeat protein